MEFLLVRIIVGVFIFILGAVIGSFSNVLIYRLPAEMSIVKPGSHCFNCNEPIKWYDNIPIISWLVLGGKCRHCKAKISPQYFIVELFTALMYLLTYLYFGLSVSTFLICLIISCLIVLSLIDYKEFIIPDSMVIGIALFAIPMFFLPEQLMASLWYEKLLGLGFILIVYLVILIFTQIRKKELMGLGDIKLLLAMSLVVSYKLMFLVLLFGSLLALLVEVIIKRKKHAVIPFGPYLSMAFLIVMFFGNKILEFYLSLF